MLSTDDDPPWTFHLLHISQSHAQTTTELVVWHAACICGWRGRAHSSGVGALLEGTLHLPEGTL